MRACLRAALAAMAIAALVVASISVGTLPATADVNCQRINHVTGLCDLVAPGSGSGGGQTDDVSDSPGGDGGQSAGGGGVGGGTCTHDGKEIDCQTAMGYWSSDLQCYLREASDPDGVGEAPAGAGPGMWAQCTPILGAPTAEWVDAIPGAPAPPPPPDPADLAQDAVAQMNLRAIDIGIVPEDQPGRVGLVGMPTWMWVEDPGGATLGPIERTATSRGYSVTATAKVQRIEWSMGDGRTVTCFGEGTVYRDAFGKQPSPTCGHSYQQRGKYTVTATSYWVVEWGGIGETGTINLDFSQSTDLVIGEAQVIVTG